MNLVFLSCLLMTLVANVMAQPDQAPKRLLVVSGGGARGAWGVGIANFLDATGKRYAHIVGTSTGSLMAPLILLRKFDKLNRAYTSVSQKDIFTINPFHKDGGIKLLNAICRFNKASLGTTENLRTLIRQFITPETYNLIRNDPSGLDFTVAIVNLRTLEPAYQSARQNPDYEQMVNWIWASANEPVFMSPYVTKNASGTEDYWVDGGVRNVIPIRQGMQIALDNNYQAVDVIVNSLPDADEPSSTWPDGNPTLFKTLIRTLDTYGSGTREMNITIGSLLDELGRVPAMQSETALADESEPSITLTFYFMPSDLFQLIPNELIFEQNKMTTLLDAGRQGRYVTRPQPEGTLAASGAPAEGTHSFKISKSALGSLLKRLNP